MLSFKIFLFCDMECNVDLKNEGDYYLIKVEKEMLKGTFQIKNVPFGVKKFIVMVEYDEFAGRIEYRIRENP